MRRISLLVCALASSSCLPSVQPELKAGVEEWRGGILEQAAIYPAMAAPGRPQPGHWAEYLEIDARGNAARVTYKILEATEGGIWCEIERRSYYATRITKILFTASDWSNPGSWSVQKALVKQGEAPVEQVDANALTEVLGPTAGFRLTPLTAAERKELWPQSTPRQAKTAADDADGQPAIGQATHANKAAANEADGAVKVPAGTFRGATKHYVRAYTPHAAHLAKGWAHGAVPATGIVEVVGRTPPLRRALVNLGRSGASSALESAPPTEATDASAAP